MVPKEGDLGRQNREKMLYCRDDDRHVPKISSYIVLFTNFFTPSERKAYSRSIASSTAQALKKERRISDSSKLFRLLAGTQA